FVRIITASPNSAAKADPARPSAIASAADFRKLGMGRPISFEPFIFRSPFPLCQRPATETVKAPIPKGAATTCGRKGIGCAPPIQLFNAKWRRFAIRQSCFLLHSAIRQGMRFGLTEYGPNGSIAQGLTPRATLVRD